MQAFFCAFSKNSRPAAKKLKAHFGQKTQPVVKNFNRKTQEKYYSIIAVFLRGLTLKVFFIYKFFIYRQKKSDFMLFLLHFHLI